MAATFASFLVLAAAVVQPVHAEDPLADKELAVERQLGCPVCTDLALNVCDNQICQGMKNVIHEQLAAGKSPDEVVAYFVNRYGEGVLLTPPRRGFNLAVWYLPIVAVLLGAAIVWSFLRRSLQRQRSVAQRLAPTDPGLNRYRQQVRHEVEVLEETS